MTGRVKRFLDYLDFLSNYLILNIFSDKDRVWFVDSQMFQVWGASFKIPAHLAPNPLN